MPFKRSSINQGPTSCTSEGNYQGPMRGEEEEEEAERVKTRRLKRLEVLY